MSYAWLSKNKKWTKRALTVNHTRLQRTQGRLQWSYSVILPSSGLSVPLYRPPSLWGDHLGLLSCGVVIWDESARIQDPPQNQSCSMWACSQRFVFQRVNNSPLLRVNVTRSMIIIISFPPSLSLSLSLPRVPPSLPPPMIHPLSLPPPLPSPPPSPSPSPSLLPTLPPRMSRFRSTVPLPHFLARL